MHKYLFLLLILCNSTRFCPPLFTVEVPAKDPPISIYVSVCPYVEIVQYMAGDSAKAIPIVTAAMSAHTFEPSPQAAAQLAKAAIWFGIGERFEKKVQKTLFETLKSSIRYINLKQAIRPQLDLFIHAYPATAAHHNGCSHESHDPHIWMSPQLMQAQITVIARELIDHLSGVDASAVEKRRDELIMKCRRLQEKADRLLTEERGKSIVAVHPAYGYLLAPYGIGQKAIEEEGKEPSPKAVTKIVQFMQQERASTIFIQPQYPSKSAEVILAAVERQSVAIDGKTVPGKTVPGKIVQLEPYSSDYFQSIDRILNEIKAALQEQKSSPQELNPPS